MNKVHVIVNPFSARGKTGKHWQVIKEAITHYFSEYKYIFTEKPRQATAIARDLLKRAHTASLILQLLYQCRRFRYGSRSG